jgi:hypothetical protein
MLAIECAILLYGSNTYAKGTILFSLLFTPPHRNIHPLGSPTAEAYRYIESDEPNDIRYTSLLSGSRFIA